MKRLTALFGLMLIAASPAAAQVAAPTRAAAKPRTIVFVGNSFTQGALSAVQRYRSNAVTDLNGDGNGGVPALFKTFTEEAGLNYAVSIEVQGGTMLGFHWDERRHLLDRRWDVVVLQEYSTLDRDRPGDPTDYRTYATQFAAMFARANPRVTVLLMATWARADLVYQPGSPWSGKPLAAMTQDLRRATDGVRVLSPTFKGVLPIGEAWTRAIAAGIADADPYDGIASGQIDLWADDYYHASAYGYYLEALIVFGRVTGIDPTTLGVKERAAEDLGLDPRFVPILQTIARDQLAAG